MHIKLPVIQAVSQPTIHDGAGGTAFIHKGSLVSKTNPLRLA